MSFPLTWLIYNYCQMCEAGWCGSGSASSLLVLALTPILLERWQYEGKHEPKHKCGTVLVLERSEIDKDVLGRTSVYLNCCIFSLLQ